MGADVYHCGLGSTVNLPCFGGAVVLGTEITREGLPSSVFDVEATLALPFFFCFLVGEAFGSLSPLDVFGVSCVPFPLAFDFFAVGSMGSAEPLETLRPERNEETSFTRAG